MIVRTLERVLRERAREYPIVTVTGPRQSGKTTLVRATFPGRRYISLEDQDQRSFAQEDPRGFLAQTPGPVILDEAQRVPTLFSYLQTAVDADPTPGRVILSGSQHFLLLDSISQSLAGRCAVLHLLPFSLSELEGRAPFPLETLGREETPTSRTSQFEIMTLLFQGGYPRIHDRGLNPQTWLRDYTQTYVERDVRTIVNVGDLEAFGRFLRLCAGRTGGILNLSSLASDCGITHTTARRWLSILEASFLVFLLRPHARNFNKRLIRSPKLYFLDTGLLCYLLRIRTPEDLRLHAMRGAIFENFVIGEVVKNRLHRGDDVDVSFWRDSAGHEIDLLIETGSTITPVEIKSGQTIAGDMLTGLRYWRTVTGQPDGSGALVYAGDQTYRREDFGVYSWACL